jgi:hypothetical protein
MNATQSNSKVGKTMHPRGKMCTSNAVAKAIIKYHESVMYVIAQQRLALSGLQEEHYDADRSYN